MSRGRPASPARVRSLGRRRTPAPGRILPPRRVRSPRSGTHPAVAVRRGAAFPRLLALLALLGALPAAACLAAGPATAQVVQGTVVDAKRGSAIPGARVLLVDSEGALVDSTATGPDGRYRVDATAPGAFMLHVARDGYLSYSTDVVAEPVLPVEHRVEMPVVSTRAARIMHEVIQREEAFRLPWEELCGEPVRPWEAGVLVGVARDRTTMEPIPRTVVRLEPGARTRVATRTGVFWFCNVPAGRVAVVARADGFADDRYTADIRAGTISWYDALLRPAR